MSDTSDTAEKRQRCAALRKDGQPCQALAMHTGLCIAHAPEANRWRVLGGQATRTSERAMKLLPLRLVPIFQRLEQVFLKLDAGEYDRQRATAMATVASVLIKIVQAGEFEERLRIIEQQVGISGRDRDRYGNAKEGPIQWPTHTPGA